MSSSMKQICHQWVEKLQCPNTGLLILRITLGAIFVAHGWGKIQGIEGTIGFFGSLGLTPFFAYLVAWVEFVGGIVMILGITVREAAMLFSIILLTAIYLVHWKQGWKGMEFPIILLGASLALVFLGSGKYSLGKIFSKEDIAVSSQV